MAYVEELLAHGATAGERGGHWLGHDTIDRYVTTGLFIALVREGWIGICGVMTRAIEQIVQVASQERCKRLGRRLLDDVTRQL